MTNSEYFKQHHYTVVKDLIPKEICNVATKYALLKMVQNLIQKMQRLVKFLEHIQFTAIP